MGITKSLGYKEISLFTKPRRANQHNSFQNKREQKQHKAKKKKKPNKRGRLGHRDMGCKTTEAILEKSTLTRMAFPGAQPPNRWEKMIFPGECVTTPVFVVFFPRWLGSAAGFLLAGVLILLS